MKTELRDLKKEISKANFKLMNFLSRKISQNGFNLKNYYGETTTAAAFSLSNKHTNLIQVLVKAYLRKDKTDIDTHWEFNNMALQNVKPEHYKEIKGIHYPLKYNISFFRKVTNWMLLRALTYLKTKSLAGYVKGNLITMLVLLSQQRKGILFDNRLYRKKELSHQYHAFATSLLGEIYLETKNLFYFNRFEDSIEFLKKITLSPNTFNIKGLRGYKQIFGYVSAIHALVLYSITRKDEEALKNAIILFNYLKKFQRKDGSLPLVLTKKEFEIKRYTNNTKSIFWESYNKYYDYLGFTAFYLAKTLELIKEYT